MSRGSFLGFVILTSGLAAGFVFLGLPRWRAERRYQNERAVVIALCSFPTIQAEFSRQDMDRNGVSNYWTGDVSGLVQYGLIERSLGEADANPLVPLCPRPIPWNGYFCVALKVDPPAQPPDKSSPWPPADWAICMYPAEPGQSGKHIYLIGSRSGRLRLPATGPPPKSWPSDAELRTWAKFD